MSSTVRTIAWESLNEGDQLTQLSFPLDMRKLMIDVSGTRDLYAIHHDRDFARANGARDIFVNTMFYEGFFGRIITDWAGPEAFLRKLRFDMRAPNCPGDVLTSRAWITKKYMGDGEKLIDVEAHIDNQLQPSATVATMTVQLP